MGERTWPGFRATYGFAPAGDSAELRLELRFDPAEAGDAAAARAAWTALRNHLTIGKDGEPPKAEPRLLTSLVRDPLDLGSDSSRLRDRLADFAATVLASLDLPDPGPCAVDLEFALPKRAAAGLPDDILRIDVELDLGVKASDSKDAPADFIRPVSVVPGMDDEPAFARAFEGAWNGFDGADGRLKLAAEGEAPGRRLWCVRTGRGSGIALAKAADPAPIHRAVPPLSTVLLYAEIAMGEGRAPTERFEAVDLDRWWDGFAEELNRLAEPDRVAAIRAESESAADRLDSVRRRVARALASRLVPVTPLDGAGPETGEVRERFEAATADRLGRPVITTAAVQVGRGSTTAKGPEWTLGGHVLATSDCAAAEGSSAAALSLGAGEQRLAIVAPVPKEQAGRPCSVRFAGEWLADGAAAPLRLLLPGEDEALHADLGPCSAPLPLVAAPQPPSLAFAAAAGRPDGFAPAEGLSWAVEVEFADTWPAAQDALELSIGFEPLAASAGAPLTPPDGLLEALARFLRFAASGSGSPSGSKSLETLCGLAEAVAKGLEDWQAPVPATAPLPPGWRYRIDFGERPALVVTRESGGAAEPPPWPLLEGYFRKGPEGSAGARYEPEPGGPAETTLRIAVPGLRVPGDRLAQVHSRVRRNGGLPDIEPAFVYHSAVVSSLPLRPCLEWQDPRADEPAPSLAAALDRAFEPLAGAVDYQLGVEAGLARRLETGEAPLESRLPLLLLPAMGIGSGTESVPALKARLASALASAYRSLGLSGGEAEGLALTLTLTLFDAGDRPEPLARLDFHFPVPDEGWWERG